MKTIQRGVLCCFLLSAPCFAMAWGMLGHRIVGEIASRYLTPKAKAEIRKLLGNETIAMTSNWADFIRSDTSYNYLSPWHYVNLGKDLSQQQVLAFLKNDTAVNVYNRINFLITELKHSRLRADKKKMYLQLLIHLVGDIHQPMHTGRREDLGGNRVKVSWFNTPTNLHAVWDEALIDHQQLSYTEYTAAINHTSLQQRQQWQKQAVSEWVLESYNIAGHLYTEITKPDQRLSYEYNFRHIATVNQRLLKAGVRLAGLLNSIFR